MLTWSDINAIRMKRQYLSAPVNREGYDDLFVKMSPVPTLYWCEPGSPPTLPKHADFDDYDYNSLRRAHRDILKGRFGGGSISYVTKEDLELFACLYKKELTYLSSIQSELLELLTQEGPMNIGLMKELTGYLVKDITPALHKLQEAFQVFEDQSDNEGDRSWFLFDSEFPEVNSKRYTKVEALKLAIPRFAYLCVFFEEGMLKSFYKLPQKLIREALKDLLNDNLVQPITVEGNKGYSLTTDIKELQNETIPPIHPRVLLLQRNDFLVRAYADELKVTYPSEWDTLYYLLIDGRFHGAVTGRFKFGPHVIEDIVLDLPEEEKDRRKEEILEAVYEVFNYKTSPVKRYDSKQQNERG